MSTLQTIVGDLSDALDKDSLRPNETSTLLRILSTAEGDDLEACAQLVGTMAVQGRAPGLAETLLALAPKVEETAVAEEPLSEEESAAAPDPEGGPQPAGESDDVQS